MKLKHVGRYGKLATLFSRYALRDFTLDPESVSSEPADEEEEDDELEPSVEERAESFARQLREMGPVYIKFGQVLSTRGDLVPPEYRKALEDFQDSLEPFPFARVEEIIEEELGARPSDIFPTLDNVPLAAASLGQVHRATLRDGRDVIVKIQRPGVEETVDEDLEALNDLSSFLEEHSTTGRRMNVRGAVREFERVLRNELDYRQEATNAATLRTNLQEFEKIYIPLVIRDLTTKRVLVMEMIQGKKIAEMSKLARLEFSYEELAGDVTRAWLKQICIDGFWHSDPHPGNIFLSDGRLVLLDFGMVSQIGRVMQDHVIRLLLSIGNNKGEEVAETCLRVGEPEEGFDRNQLIRDISGIVTETQGLDPRRLNTGQVLFRVIHVAMRNKVKLPSELSLLAKTLLHLDSITRSLDPEYNPQKEIHDYAEELIIQKLQQRLRPNNFYSALLDLDRLITELPQRARDLLDQVTTGQFTIAVRLTQVEHLLKGIQKVANRITAGLVIAALLVASALMMRVGGGFSIAGYNGLSVIGFVIAIIAATYLLFQTFMQDRRDRRKAEKRWDR